MQVKQINNHKLTMYKESQRNRQGKVGKAKSDKRAGWQKKEQARAYMRYGSARNKAQAQS